MTEPTKEEEKCFKCCAVCKVVLQNEQNKDDLCSACLVWDHVFAISEDEYLKTGDKSCLLCKKLHSKAGRQEFKYPYHKTDEQAEELDTQLTQEAATDEELPSTPQGDFPTGQEANWDFYINLFTKSGLNVKLGDCVYYENASTIERAKAELQSKPVLRVQFLIRDTSGHKWISGYQIATPGQVESKTPKRRRRLMPVSDELGSKIFGDRFHVQNSDIFIQLDQVEGFCCGLGLCDFEFGRPRRIKPEDVFSIGNLIDLESGLIAPSFPDFKVCKNNLIWKDFDDGEVENIVVIFSDDKQNDKKQNSILTPKVNGTPASKVNRLSWADKSSTPQKLVQIKLFERDNVNILPETPAIKRKKLN